MLLSVAIMQPVSARADTTLRLSPIVNASEMYDDNILLSPTAPQADFVTNILLGFNLNFDNEQRSGSFMYETVVQTFVEHPQYDDLAGTHFFSLNDVEKLSSTTSLTFSDFLGFGEFTGALLNPTAPGVTPQLAFLAGSTANFLNNIFTATLQQQLSDRWNSSLALSQNTFSFSGGQYYMQTATAQALYSLTPELSVGPSYAFGDYRFSNFAPVESQFAQAVAQWQATPQLQFNGSAGPMILQYSGGPTQAYPGYQGSATYKGSRWTMNVIGGQMPNITFGVGTAGVERYGAGTFQYRLGRYTTAFVSAGYFQFTGGGTAGFDFLSYGGGVIVTVNKWLTLSAQYMGMQEEISGVAGGVRPLGLPVGQQAVANVFMIGATINFELYRTKI